MCFCRQINVQRTIQRESLIDGRRRRAEEKGKRFAFKVTILKLKSFCLPHQVSTNSSSKYGTSDYGSDVHQLHHHHIPAAGLDSSLASMSSGGGGGGTNLDSSANSSFSARNDTSASSGGLGLDSSSFNLSSSKSPASFLGYVSSSRFRLAGWKGV